MTADFSIAGRRIGAGEPVYVIAELSANHRQRYEAAVQLVHAANEAGADAVKLQTYTPDTITIPSAAPPFRHAKGSLWAGQTLYDLYREAYTPWDWQPKLKALAGELGMACFSSPFDPTAVDFLLAMDVPAFKVASFELVDLPLVRQMAATGRPMIMSTGMATEAEIDEAVAAAISEGATEIALLKCTSAYPSPPEAVNLRAIPAMADRWGLPIGLSDHTTGVAVPVAAVALGACIIEKHITLSRDDPTPDAPFSLDPADFKAMVAAVRVAERALGGAALGPTPEEADSRRFRRSLFVVEDVAAGETITGRNVRSIRPADGLHTRHLDEVLGRRAARDIERGTPLSWELLAPAADREPG
ncbi:MAG: pseudaminic acid synthase [Candidatus Limnocylindrales bacterium]